MCFFHDFWTRAKTGLGHGTRSKWAHFGRRKCCQFSQCGHGSAAKLFSKRFRMGSLSERKFHDSWSCFLMSFFSTFSSHREKTHTDEKKWVHFRRPKRAHHPFLRVALWTRVFFASENEYKWVHFRRPKWAHFQRVRRYGTVFAPAQKSRKKHIKTNHCLTFYWVAMMNLGWHDSDMIPTWDQHEINMILPRDQILQYLKKVIIYYYF